MRINFYSNYNNIYFCSKNNSDNNTHHQTTACNTKTECIPFDKLGFYTSLISKKPVLDDDTFQIRMWGYLPENTERKDNKDRWNRQMLDLTYKISDMISENKDFDIILKSVEDGINIINGFDYGKRDLDDRRYYPLEDEISRGIEYWDSYDKKLNGTDNGILIPKPNKKYKDANVCRIIDKYSWQKRIYYGRNPQKPYYNLELAKKEYEKLKSIKQPKLRDINRTCATIQWLIAQESPYCHGNDSIANILTKSIYHSYGINPGQIKRGHSLDFEAFYRDLSDYIEIYPTLLEKLNPPSA